MKYFLLLSIMGLTACAHEAITRPVGPGGAIIGVDSTGITFNDQGKALWVNESIPAEWFVKTSQGWHLTTLQWHQGNAIRLKRFNP